MNLDSHFRNWKQLAWPVVGLILGAIVAVANPFHAERISLLAGIASWFAAMTLVLILSAHRIAARIGALLAGLMMAVPCFVAASPLHRVLLMCFMSVPWLAAAALLLAPPIAGIRARLAYLCTWCGTRRVERRVQCLDTAVLRDLIVATIVLAASIAVVQANSALGLGRPVQWLAGGIGILAFAEMVTAGLPFVTAAFGLTVPPLFQSPHRSTSLAEFWAVRWNCGASELFRKFCFTPLARRSAALALCATFFVSAVGHTLLAYMALGIGSTSLICGAFFLVQPPLLAVERRLAVRRWQPWTGRIWTLAVLALASPLIVEPALQIVERSWGVPGNVLLSTFSVLLAVILFSSLIALASRNQVATSTSG